jgi:uncharacterized repeat protein (TIGR03803 family)
MALGASRLIVFITQLAGSLRAVAYALVFLMMVLPTQLPAQTYTVIRTFMNGADGANPEAGVTIDKAGNLYGTTSVGGSQSDEGAVYKLTKKGGNWVLSALYAFTGGADGGNPLARVVFGPDGSLYGTTYAQGCANAGTVFNLKPPASACKAALCPWTETVLYCFQQSGAEPTYGDLIFDQAGNIYGTTQGGGDFSLGTVFMLTPSNGTWTESLLHSFGGGVDGRLPYNGVIFDGAGNLYGTTYEGGMQGQGVVFQLVPSEAGWTENILHDFLDQQDKQDGSNPYGGLIFDQSGNLVGTTSTGGQNDGGTAFELVPSDGTFTLQTIANLTPFGEAMSTLTMDSAGNLYGTTYVGGKFNRGSVFEFTPSGGSWILTTLYSFTDTDDGGYPIGSVTLDANGNIFGTTYHGGAGPCSGGCGVVFEIAP